MIAREWLDYLCRSKGWQPRMLAQMSGALSREVSPDRLTIPTADAVAQNLNGVPTLPDLLAQIRDCAPGPAGGYDREAQEARVWVHGTRQRIAANPKNIRTILSMAERHAPRQAWAVLADEYAAYISAEVAKDRQWWEARIAQVRTIQHPTSREREAQGMLRTLTRKAQGEDPGAYPRPWAIDALEQIIAGKAP